MFVRLDNDVIDILCCPLCKAIVQMEREKFVCKDCGTEYCRHKVVQGGHEEHI